ncbi:DUF736 family protein (plasmid) [Sinorhizobium meliloti]|nr:DUF736 family protein [Sinorhizobium meliloti]
MGHVLLGLDEACLIGEQLASIVSRNGHTKLSSPKRSGAHSSRNNKVSPGPSSIPFRPVRCGPIVPDPCDSHRGREGRGPNQRKEHHNGTIGTFNSTESGFNGSIPHARPQRQGSHRPHRKPLRQGPALPIYAGNVELGAAWQKRVRAGPRLPLGQSWTTRASPRRSTQPSRSRRRGRYQLIWSRPNRD